MMLRAWIGTAIVLGAIGLWPAPARATIVWEGKVVSAWPDLPPPTTSTFHQFAENHFFPHPSGELKGLVILVDFSDKPATMSKEDIDGWLNTKGYNKNGLTGSIRDYFLGQSNGMVDYQNEVHGYYRAKQPKSYYDSGSDYARADELWNEVITAMDGEIDFSLFDNDKDGKTDAISLLYAGDEGTFGVGLWPHASMSRLKKDGVTLNRYMMTALHSKPTNYVFAHESGHMLFGWPDLYGVGDYCVMGNRGADTNPVGINDMFRVDQGWIEVVDIDKSSNASYMTAPDAPAYRFVNPARSGELFLWSNVQPAREWVSIKGGGILLWHFDNSIAGNEPPAKLQLAVVQGGGTRILSATTWPSPGSAATDFFYKGNNTEFGAATKPASTWNNGSASGLRIYDISANGAQMTFSVGTGPLPDGGVVIPDASRDSQTDTSRDAVSNRDTRDGAAGGALSTGGSGGRGGTGGASAAGGTSAGTSSGGARSSAGTVASGGTVSSGGALSSSSMSASGGARSSASSRSRNAAGGSIAGGQTTSGSAGGSSSQGVTSASTTTAGSSSSGCSCSLGRPVSPPAWAGLLLLVSLLARHRRRR